MNEMNNNNGELVEQVEQVEQEVNSLLINNKLSLNQFLKKNYCEEDYYTHTSMIEPYGKFIFGRDQQYQLFNKLGNGDEIHGITQKPSAENLLYFDIDIKINVNEKYSYYFNNGVSHLYDHNDVITFIGEINGVLKSFGINELSLDCFLLEKHIYITKCGKFVKNGFHLMYPKIILNKHVFTTFILPQIILNCKTFKIDNMYNNPWLMYRGVKSVDMSPYCVSKIFNSDIKEINIMESLRYYDIFDMCENRLNINEDNCISLLPRILSIFPGHRKIMTINPRFLRLPEKKKEIKNIVVKDESESDKDDNESDIDIENLKLLTNLISFTGARNEWQSIGFTLSGLSKKDDDLFEYFNERCQEYYCYDGDKSRKENQKLWDKDSKGNIGVLINLAKKHNLKEYEKIKHLFYTKKNDFCHLDENSFIQKDDKYVNQSIYESNERVILVRAGLGTGKTTSMIDFLNKQNDDQQIIVITPRKTFASSIFNRLLMDSKYKDFQLYTDKKLDYLIKNPRVVIQCESLHRLDEFKFKDDLIIVIDEIESFLSQLTSVTTHKKNHVSNISIVEKMMKCSKIIGLDAFLGEKTIEFFKSLHLSTKCFNYTRLLCERKCIKIDEEFVVFKQYVLKQISNGKRMYIFISTKSKSELFYYDLKKLLPDKKVALYNSDHKESLENVNVFWATLDVVITTSTITVGVDFNVKNHFHSIGIYLSAGSKNLVRDVMQSAYRPRHLIDDLLIYCLDVKHHGMNLSLNRGEIKTGLDNLSRGHIALYEKIHNKNHIMPNPLWLEDLFVRNILEQNQTIMDLENVFNRYLKICNYTPFEPVFSDEDFLPVFKDDKEDNSHRDKKDWYVKIPNLTIDEMKTIRKKDIKSNSDKLSLDKFFYKQTFMNDDISIEDEESVFTVYLDHKSKFTNLSYEKGMVNRTLNLVGIVKETLPILAKKLHIRLDLVNRISDWYGFKHTHDFHTEISTEKINSLQKLFSESITEIYDVFEIRKPQGNKDAEMCIRKIITITNLVLKKWGFSELKTNCKRESRRQTNINGKWQYVNTYNLVSTLTGLQDLSLDGDSDIFTTIKPKNNMRPNIIR